MIHQRRDSDPPTLSHDAASKRSDWPLNASALMPSAGGAAIGSPNTVVGGSDAIADRLNATEQFVLVRQTKDQTCDASLREGY